ncbi:MFS general substrate transporter [Suillus paluster]|uniref:MFS general substrate transporter n=1 Tax=Suillus paluster TaxID=48578 RepID=UPI001B88276E|nr:MFS general substrate transporter [Suillus paluster]KAG1756627.1 MFS general substrate transporter [Suillus paluster]
MSDYRPLLDHTGNSSPHYGTSSDATDGPTLSYVDEQNRPMVEKRLIRKLDLRVAFLVLIYIMSCMDRSNVAYVALRNRLVVVCILTAFATSAARLGGFEEDLGLTGNQFNTLISIFYTGYVLMQTPSNVFLDRINRPSLYLSSCMAMWGAITVFMGASRTYHTAFILRFFLGFVEAAFFPGAAFLLSRWYKRNELGLRMALFFCGNSISYAFGPLVASGILACLDGTLGFPAWRWLFFLEGTLTIVVAVSAIWILPDFPSTPSVWLSPDEHVLAKRRMEEETTTGDEHQGKPVEGFSGLGEALVDWKVWWLGAALCFLVASLSCSNFFPTLSATMGYSATVSLLLCAPPWILGTATSFIVAWHSDATGERFWHIAGPLLVGVAGFIIAISTMNTAVRYLSLFFMTQPPVAFVIFLTWVMNTFSQSQSKRAAAVGIINSMGMFGNMGASYFWPSSWGPTYVNSYLICILTSIICIVMCWAFRQHLARCNEAAEAEEEALGLPKGFRYLL